MDKRIKITDLPTVPKLDLKTASGPAKLRQLHGGAKAEVIYVIMNKDGSSVVKDPGLGRPWSSKNKKLAEHHAKQIGNGACAIDLVTAMHSIMRHPKNLPKGLPPGFKFPL